MSMNDDIKTVLVSEEQLKAKVAELGARISKDYEGKNLVLVSILKGSVVFMADLMRAVTIPCSIDFMVVSSYGGSNTVTSFQKMMRDDNFTVEELGAIAFGYTKLLEESNDVLTELRNVVNITTLSMTDKERMDVVERCYSKMKHYRNLVSYYTNKNISVSYLRAKKKNDLDRIMGLYGNMNERYW
mgnify:CR=1 FL=1